MEEPRFLAESSMTRTREGYKLRDTESRTIYELGRAKEAAATHISSIRIQKIISEIQNHEVEKLLKYRAFTEKIISATKTLE